MGRVISPLKAMIDGAGDGERTLDGDVVAVAGAGADGDSAFVLLLDSSVEDDSLRAADR